jgi:ABC-type multidrug transport system fused ATPase/permease subunit
MIREVFADCTIFAIAHRLATIIDYDTILVLDGGALAEHGHPAVLLRNPDGPFARLVEDSGPAMASHLRGVAEAAYRQQQQIRRR